MDLPARRGYIEGRQGQTDSSQKRRQLRETGAAPFFVPGKSSEGYVEAQEIGAWFLSSLLGGGVVFAVGYRALKDRLIQDLLKIFAKQSTHDALAKDVDNLGGRVTGAISMATMAKETGDTNSDAIIRLQSSEEHRWEPMARALDRLSKRLDDSEKRAERHTALLDEISRRLDRHDNNHHRGN